MNLEKLYKMQEELDRYIIKNRNIVMSDKELLDKTILALLVEVGELANATRCFKHWSTKASESKERLLDELADVWHFYLSIGNQVKHKFNYELARYVMKYQRKLGEKDLTKQFIGLYEGMAKLEIGGIGVYLINIADILGYTDEEVEQAYLKKHEENYRRQREGY